MADFTTLDTTKDSGQGTCRKLEGFVSFTGDESDYETVGVVRNETSFNVVGEYVEYKDGFASWLICKVSEELTIESAFMQHNARLLALATGRGATDETSETAYALVEYSDTPENPPRLRWKFVGQTKDGKAFEHEFFKAQIMSDMNATYGGGDAAELPFTLKATVDETITSGANVGVSRYEK